MLSPLPRYLTHLEFGDGDVIMKRDELACYTGIILKGNLRVLPSTTSLQDHPTLLRESESVCVCVCV